MQGSQNPGAMCGGDKNLYALSVEVALCHSSGT